MRRYRFALLLVLIPAGILSAQQVVHRVKPGDTLYSIARSYGVPVERILEENGIDDPRYLLVGKELDIPLTYVVSPGDTLYSIARRYEVDVEKLRDLNELSSDTIVIGQRLTLPEEARHDDKRGVAAGDREDSGEGRERAGSSDGESSEDEAPPSVFRQQVVAETMNRPLGFTEGGSWPVAGERYAMEGKLPGVMIQGDFGDAVNSVSSGRVIYAGPHTSFGNVVFVQSAQGYIYVYGGNEEVVVSVGEEVSAGSPIGTLGRSPAEQRALLYFSVWKENSFVSPEKAPRG
ncbi:MAG: LysM peptidoglycan-binding domain-containing protein [Alkalispirochaetaceae bacterium]